MRLFVFPLAFVKVAAIVSGVLCGGKGERKQGKAIIWPHSQNLFSRGKVERDFNDRVMSKITMLVRNVLQHTSTTQPQFTLLVLGKLKANDRLYFLLSPQTSKISTVVDSKQAQLVETDSSRTD